MIKKLKTLGSHFARGVKRCEHPFHLAYLGAGSHYYYKHGVIMVAATAGSAFAVVFLIYIIEILEVLRKG